MHPSPWPTARTWEYAARSEEREPKLPLRHDQVQAGFPQAMRRLADQVADVIPPDGLRPSLWVPLRLDDQAIAVPGRIYNAPIPADAFEALSEDAQAMALTLYTSHHDGYVRQDAVTQLVERAERWMAPHLLLRIGDMVQEVVAPIADALMSGGANGAKLLELLAESATLNPAAFRTTRSRATGYWYTYYRREFPTREEHPGVAACERIVAALPASALLRW